MLKLTKMLPPDYLAVVHIDASEDAADAQRKQPAVMTDRSGFRTLPMSSCRRVHLIGSRIGDSPEFASGGEIETSHDLFFTLSREDVGAFADY
jgi:hypothetical protein